MPATELFTPRLDREIDPGGPVRPGTEEGVATRETVGNAPDGTILVLGESDEIGRRVVERLVGRGLPVRVGSRAAAAPFDWEDQATWGPALCGVDGIFLTYNPDLAVPGAVEKLCLFAALAVGLGARRLVLLSEGGAAEARCAEEVVRGTSATWTILRSSRLCQTFSESSLRDAVRDGEVVLPAGGAPRREAAWSGEPFVDADVVADVVVAALTEDGYAGRLYELTGLRLRTLA